MAEMLKAYPLYLNIGLIEPDGNLTCSAVPLREPVNVADRLYFELAIQTRDFVVGDYQTGRVTKLPAINYAYPLLDAAGNVEAVIYIAQNLDWLTMALAGVQLPSGAVLAVTDRNATVLARVPPAEGAVGMRLAEPALIAAHCRAQGAWTGRKRRCRRRQPAVGVRAPDRRQRLPRDDRSVEVGCLRRHRSPAGPQSLRIRPGHGPGAGALPGSARIGS